MSRTLLMAMLILSSYAQASGDALMMRSEALRALLAQVYDTYGGEQTIGAISNYHAVSTTKRPLINQSRHLNAPWDIGTSTLTTKIDFSSPRFLQTTLNPSAGNERHQSWVINDDERHEYDHFRKVHHHAPTLNYNASVARVSRSEPLLLLRQILTEETKAKLIGWRELDDSDFIMVDLYYPDQPTLSLYINNETMRIDHAIRLIDNVGLVRYDYQGVISGGDVSTAQSVSISVAGQHSLGWQLQQVSVDQPWQLAPMFDESSLIISTVSNTMTGKQLSDRLWLVGKQYHYSLMQLTDEGWIAYGGSAGGAERYQWARNQVADKPLIKAVVTHHHSDHIASVDEWLELGATIVASAAHRDLFTGESYQNRPFEWVIGSRSQHGIRLIDVGPTAHSDSVLVAWHEGSQTLFEEDHFLAPQDGPLGPISTAGAQLQQQLTRLNIVPSKIVGGHSSRIMSLDQLPTLATNE